MPARRASPPSRSNDIIEHHAGRNIALGLIATAVIIIILTSGVLNINFANGGNKNLRTNPNYEATVHTQNLISGSIVLNPSGYYFTGFSVPENALTPVLQGNFTSTSNSTNNNIIVTVWSQKNFTSWLSCLPSDPCYNKDLMPAVMGDINVTLSSGSYFVVFSSASVEAKTVSAQIDLTYSS